MDHRSFIASLPDRDKAQLTERSDSMGLRHLTGHVAAIVIIGALIATGMPGWWLLLPVQGILLVFLFTLEHEATHKTPFASEALNEWVGRIIGMLLLVPFTWFRYFHLAHHRFTHDPEKDPELLSGAKPETWRAYAFHVSGLPYWRGMAVQFGQLVLGRGLADYIPANAKGRVIGEARMTAFIYVLLASSLLVTPILFWIWILPILLGQPFLRLYLLAEHTRCPHVADMFENSRTTFTTRLVRWLAWNMPYHAEHHAMPMVPFHKLPTLHRLTKEHLQQTEDGYTTFHRKLIGDF